MNQKILVIYYILHFNLSLFLEFWETFFVTFQKAMLSIIDPLDEKIMVQTLNVPPSSKLRESLLLGIVNVGSSVYNLNIFYQSSKT